NRSPRGRAEQTGPRGRTRKGSLWRLENARSLVGERLEDPAEAEPTPVLSAPRPSDRRRADHRSAKRQGKATDRNGSRGPSFRKVGGARQEKTNGRRTGERSGLAPRREIELRRESVGFELRFEQAIHEERRGRDADGIGMLHRQPRDEL